MTPGAARAVTSFDWDPALAAAVHGRGVDIVYQPIVGLEHGTVAGYEALARLGPPGSPSPDRWFDAARARGLGDRLEAAVIHRALAARATMPPNTFLTVNVAPMALASRPVSDVFTAAGDLGGVVVELTEQTPIESYTALEPHLDRLRSAGALIAIDDAGAGYAGLRHMLALRPSIVKLDRELVCDLDRDEARRALVEIMGTFASRIDAWLLAEGIERVGELDALLQLGVPLAQGYLLCRPSAPWAEVDPAVVARLRSRRDAGPAPAVRTLVEVAPWVPSDEPRSAMALLGGDGEDLVVVCDERQRPLGMVTLGSFGDLLGATKVHVDTPVAEAALRAITRPADERFRPLVCCDAVGRYLGVVRVERLVHHLATT